MFIPGFMIFGFLVYAFFSMLEERAQERSKRNTEALNFRPHPDANNPRKRFDRELYQYVDIEEPEEPLVSES